MNFIIVLSALYFLLRGICKGMEMVHPMDDNYASIYLTGIRSHKWFPIYHILDILKDVLLILCTVIFSLYPQYRSFLWCIAVWGWEESELGYAFARNNLNIFRFPENIFGTGLRVSRWMQRWLHFTRIFMGILFALVL